jgi:hypothetical protein
MALALEEVEKGAANFIRFHI